MRFPWLYARKVRRNPITQLGIPNDDVVMERLVRFFERLSSGVISKARIRQVRKPQLDSNGTGSSIISLKDPRRRIEGLSVRSRACLSRYEQDSFKR